MNDLPSTIDTIIIGAGPSGLACALQCQMNNKQFLLVEQSDRVGGRIGSIQEDEYIFSFSILPDSTRSVITLCSIGKP